MFWDGAVEAGDTFRKDTICRLGIFFYLEGRGGGGEGGREAGEEGDTFCKAVKQLCFFSGGNNISSN